MKRVTLRTGWADLFGKPPRYAATRGGEEAGGRQYQVEPAYIPPVERRRRWEAWKALCRAEGAEGRESLAEWEAPAECAGCRHHAGDWCALQDLPAAVNPVLTFRHGIPGMACMGAGYEALTPTGELPL